MPKQAAEIRNFNKGMVTNVDITDLDINIPIYAKGLETHNQQGSLSGSKADESVLDNYEIENGVPFSFNGADLVFAVDTSGDYYFLYNLYTTPNAVLIENYNDRGL